MKLVIQVVKSAEIRVVRHSDAEVSEGKETVAEIGKGMLVFVCFEREEDKKHFKYFSEKLPELKIFKKATEYRIDQSLREIDGEILVVSQFTLSAILEGTKPTFHKALPSKQAKVYFEEFIEELKKVYPKTKSGVFGAQMEVELINDGPITFILEK